MGTNKRQRQKQGRQARVDAAITSQRQAETRRRMMLIGSIVAFVALIAGVLFLINRDDDDNGSTASADDTTTTVGELESAAGKPCVPLSEPAPAGAPEIPVPEGPPPTELVIEDLTEGEGAEVPTEQSTQVTVNYIGVACSTGKIFDTSWEQGREPATFPLGGVIAGWLEGIPGMKAGGQRLLVIPPEMGYGSGGSPPDIGPDETLIFVVELISFEEGAPTATVPDPPGAGASITGETPCPAVDGSSPRTTSFAGPPPMCIDEAKTYTAIFDTTAGRIEVRLDAASMPRTTNNFVVLARYGYYDGTAIFRSDPSIDILQGGAPQTNSASDPGPGYTIDDEPGPFTYETGQLVMARTQAPNSSGAQFFLTTGPRVSALDSQGTYLLFGEIVEGLEVAQAIMATHVPDPTSGMGGSPNPAVIINSVTIEES
jgi:cyclophilin family peptidyl-prolyl cis-trans isomerase